MATGHAGSSARAEEGTARDTTQATSPRPPPPNHCMTPEPPGSARHSPVRLGGKGLAFEDGARRGSVVHTTHQGIQHLVTLSGRHDKLPALRERAGNGARGV